MNLEKTRNTLLARRNDLLGDIADKQDQIDENTSTDDEDKPAERQEEEVLAALSHADQAEVSRIDAALARIDDGSYGICANCGEPIAAARLQALPDAVTCVNCAEAAES